MTLSALRARPSPGLLLGVVLGAGAALRLWTYLRNPSLSFDETMLSLNVVSRSFLGLLRPLDYAQTAPVLYLWLTKLAVLIGGVNEYALRALPLIAGLVLPYATWRLARQLVPASAALLAAAFVALAPGLVQYAGIVKPYGVDALVTVVVIELCLHLRADLDSTPQWLTLLAAGVVAIALSTPALFVLAAIGGILFIEWLPRRDTRTGMWLAALAVTWLGLFGVLYATVYRAAATSAFMQEFWTADFLTPSAFVLGARAWRILRDSFLTAFLLRPSPLIPVLCFWAVAGTGLAWLALRRRWTTLALVLGPIAITAAASAFRRYPFSWRLLQFAMPLVALWLAAGFAAALERWNSGRRVMWSAAGVMLLALLGVNVTHPYREPPVRELIAKLTTRAASSDPVYVFVGSIPAWAFYATDWSSADTARLTAFAHTRHAPNDAIALEYRGRTELVGRSAGIEWSPGVGPSQSRPDTGWASGEAARIQVVTHGVIWLIFTQSYRTEVPDLLAAVRARGGVTELADERPGASLYRVRFTR